MSEQTNYRAIVERIAVILHGKVTDIDLLTVTVLAMKERNSRLERQRDEQPAPVVPDDYFASLVTAARARAEKAMRKFPQPNYVLNKVAEESGEVIKAVIHYTEGRETWQNVETEIIDNLAMLIRLVAEGDGVIGFTPPDACRAAMLQGKAEPVSPAYKLPSGWVKCSERMPDEGAEVYIFCDGEWVLEAQYRQGDFYDVVRDGSEVFETVARCVSHWQPRPQRPAAPGKVG